MKTIKSNKNYVDLEDLDLEVIDAYSYFGSDDYFFTFKLLSESNPKFLQGIEFTIMLMEFPEGFAIHINNEVVALFSFEVTAKNYLYNMYYSLLDGNLPVELGFLVF